MTAGRIEPVITYSTYGAPNPSAVYDAAGRIRVYEAGTDRVGYATLTPVWDGEVEAPPASPLPPLGWHVRLAEAHVERGDAGRLYLDLRVDVDLRDDAERPSGTTP